MTLRTLLLAATVAMVAMPASAGLRYVGKWRVDQGPDWSTQPVAYTGQEAAALLFGRTAADYQISTIDRSAANINRLAWYSVIGAGAFTFADDYSNKFEGTLYGPVDGYLCCGEDFKFTNAASAYVLDNATGAEFTNYAFVDFPSVPEPASWAMLIAGFGLTGAALRRRRALAAA